jgi:adenylate kinase
MLSQTQLQLYPDGIHMNLSNSVVHMAKRVILITGTPCVGKTTIAKQLAEKLKANYLNLTDLAFKYDLTLGEDKNRRTTIIDEARMHSKLSELTRTIDRADVVIDGHYAAAVTPKEDVTNVFVLRRNPVQLRELMEKKGFKDQKLWENLASEILDVCLLEALREQDKAKVCELDATNKSPEDIVQEILAVLENSKTCVAGRIDWIGQLEKEGKLDEYLRI